VDGAARHTRARRGQEAGVTNANADKQELLSHHLEALPTL
jgi:hypothetical protein